MGNDLNLPWTIAAVERGNDCPAWSLRDCNGEQIAIADSLDRQDNLRNLKYLQHALKCMRACIGIDEPGYGELRRLRNVTSKIAKSLKNVPGVY